MKNWENGSTNNELLKNASVNSWDLVFKAFVEFNTSEKKLIVIDEFQYLGKANSAFPSIFQRRSALICVKKN